MKFHIQGVPVQSQEHANQLIGEAIATAQAEARLKSGQDSPSPWIHVDGKKGASSTKDLTVQTPQGATFVGTMSRTRDFAVGSGPVVRELQISALYARDGASESDVKAAIEYLKKDFAAAQRDEDAREAGADKLATGKCTKRIRLIHDAAGHAIGAEVWQ
jgi:hypothetical protein